VTPCTRCGVKAARGKPHHWRPDLCGDCAEAIKHPAQRCCEWTRDLHAARAANEMLAEVDAYSDLKTVKDEAEQRARDLPVLPDLAVFPE
jgi:hypothetical protein